MAAHQASPSLGFSRQEHWSGVPFPSPMHESESEVAQSCPAFSDPMDCSPPGSSIHGIFQARYWSGVPLPSLSSKLIDQFFPLLTSKFSILLYNYFNFPFVFYFMVWHLWQYCFIYFMSSWIIVALFSYSALRKLRNWNSLSCLLFFFSPHIFRE